MFLSREVNTGEYTFSEPILIATPGGRLAWIKRVLITFLWCILVLLVIQGLVKFRADVSLLEPPLLALMTIYAILCNCIRRKIEAFPGGDLRIHKFPASNHTVLSLTDDWPITISDYPERGELRYIQLNTRRYRFTMLITDDESKRLASWANSNSNSIAYIRRD